jgi:hypothetical protein
VEERMGDEGRGSGAFRNGTRAASPQHDEGSIAHYLPFVYYYLVGTSFETGTRSESETPRPELTHEAEALGCLPNVTPKKAKFKVLQSTWKSRCFPVV